MPFGRAIMRLAVAFRLVVVKKTEHSRDGQNERFDDGWKAEAEKQKQREEEAGIEKQKSRSKKKGTGGLGMLEDQTEKLQIRKREVYRAGLLYLFLIVSNKGDALLQDWATNTFPGRPHRLSQLPEYSQCSSHQVLI